MYGDNEHLMMFTAEKRSVESGQELFSDIFATASIRQPEFYAAMYDRALAMVGRLAMPIDKITDSTFQTNHRWPTGYEANMHPALELGSFVETKNWLFNQTLSENLVCTIAMAAFPRFMWYVYDEMRFHDSKYEENFFNYLYSKFVIGTIIDAPKATVPSDYLKHTMSRWWLLYVVRTFADEMPKYATEFISKLGLTSGVVQVSKSLAISAAKEIFASMKIRVKKLILECSDVGMGYRIYEYVRPLLDEIVMVRHATAEPSRIEFKIDNAAGVNSKFKIITRDKSIWYKHVKRIADSYMYQAYEINSEGILEPILATNELSDFVTGNLAFANGDLNVNEFVMNDFTEVAFDGRYFIDTSRISSMINENGFNIPHAIEGFNIIYSNNTKDLWFSTNIRDAITAPISALDLDLKIKMEHLFNGKHFKIGEGSYEFHSALTAELGMILMQRVFALILPETSPTGTLVTTYANIHGTVLIDGSSVGLSLWIMNHVTGGANDTLYNNTTPFLSYLSRLRIEGVPVSNSKEILIGSELIKQFYAIANLYGFNDLKTQMLKTWDANGIVKFPNTTKLIGGWTSAYGQTNALKPLAGYGVLLKEAQCQKHLFSTISSSALLDVYARSVSLFLSYDMSEIGASTIVTEFKKEVTEPNT